MKQSHTKNEAGNFFVNDKRNIWILYISFLLFNVIFAIQYRAPFTYPDEYGVFAAGNWMLGGEPWAYKSSMYYGYTFSPFVGLMLRLFHTIRPIYIGSLCIKALQVSLIPVLAYRFLHEVLELEEPRVNLLLSTSVSLYPSLTLYAKYVSNETSLHVTLFICLYLIGKLAVGQTKKITRLYSALLGFFAVFAYASHGMGLALIVAICLVIPVAHIGTKKKLVSYPIFISSLVSFYFLDSKIKDLVMNAVNSISERGMANTFSYGFSHMIPKLLDLEFYKSFFDLLISRLLYISSSTFGLFLLSFIIVLVFIFRFALARFAGKLEPQNNTLFVVAMFGIMIFLCGIGLSTLNNVPRSGVSSRMYFYGRYYEYMALPLILVALYRLYSQNVKKMELLLYTIVSSVCYLALSVYTYFQVMPFVSGSINRFFILGILPYLGNTGTGFTDAPSQGIPHFSLSALWVVTVVVFFLMVYLIKGKRRMLALVVLSGMFLYGIIFCHTIAVLPLSTANYERFYSRMEPIEAALGEFRDVYQQYPKLFVVSNRLGASATSMTTLLRTRAQLSLVNYSVAQVMLVDEFSVAKDLATEFEDSIIVSDQELKYLSTDDAYQKIYESPNACIWIHGDKIRAYYANRP